MQLEGVSHRIGGQRVLRRMTLARLDDGSVRQRSERSTDDGKSWTLAYDYRYVRAR